MLREGKENGCYIVSSNQIITKKQLVEIICDVVGYRGPVLFNGSLRAG